MEIKIKIPTFFARYRIIKTNGVFVAQYKKTWWRSLDKELYGWSDLELKYTSCSSIEEAMERINAYKQKVVWSGR